VVELKIRISLRRASPGTVAFGARMTYTVPSRLRRGSINSLVYYNKEETREDEIANRERQDTIIDILRRIASGRSTGCWEVS